MVEEIKETNAEVPQPREANFVERSLVDVVYRLQADLWPLGVNPPALTVNLGIGLGLLLAEHDGVFNNDDLETVIKALNDAIRNNYMLRRSEIAIEKASETEAQDE